MTAVASPAPNPAAVDAARRVALARALATDAVAAVIAATCLWIYPRVDPGIDPGGKGVIFVMLWLTQAAAAAVLWPARWLGLRGGRTAQLGPPAYAAACTALALLPVAAAITSGAWIREQSYAGALHALVPAVGAVGAAGVAYLFFSWPRARDPRFTYELSFAAMGIALSVNWAHAHFVPGLYPEAHLALAATAALLAQLGVHSALAVQARIWPAFTRALPVLGAVAFIALLIGVKASLPPNRLTTTQLLLKSPRAAYVLRAFTQPPPSTELYDALATLDARTPAPTETEGAPSGFVVPKDWNVVLVVVDALRADTLPPARDVYPHTRFTPNDAPFLSYLANHSYRFTRAYAAATFTDLSMPSMFHSRWAWEDTTKGIPLPVLMSERGRYPMAVVNDFFMEPGDPGLEAMLDGFAEVDVYSKLRQNEQGPRLAAHIAQQKGRPFFLWTHYYAVHSPGWDGAPIPRNDAAWPKNYVRGVRWVDQQVAGLYRALETAGVADKTVFIVTADHGEGLLDNGDLWHGPNVYEEGTRVPLFIHIPGRSGALIDRTVGNIDLVPTLLSLLGGSPTTAHRGRSLLPLFADPTTPWDDTYLLQSAHGEQVGAVAGAGKHVIDGKTGLHFHFDLAKDPLEEHGTYDPAVPAQRKLLGDLVALSPGPFAAGLSDTDTSALLDKRLAEVKPDAPPATLPFLLSLIRLSPTRARIDWALGLFDAAPTDDTRMRIIEALGSVAKAELEGKITARLQGTSDAAARAAFVDKLADLAPDPFATDWFAQAVTDAAAQDRSTWLPWLRLVAPWRMTRTTHAAALARMLQTLDTSPQPNDAMLERLILEAVSHLVTPTDGDLAALVPLVRKRLASPNVTLEAAACVAAGHLAAGRAPDPSLDAALRTRLDGRPFIVRIGALTGLTAMLGAAAIPELDRLGRDRTFTFAVVGLLDGLRRPEGLPFLDWATANATNDRARAEARRVAGRLRMAQPTPAP